MMNLRKSYIVAVPKDLMMAIDGDSVFVLRLSIVWYLLVYIVWYNVCFANELFCPVGFLDRLMKGGHVIDSRQVLEIALFFRALLKGNKELWTNQVLSSKKWKLSDFPTKGRRGI